VLNQRLNIQKPKTILISPLNWGLGHAVRDIPLIHKLIASNYKVIIATEGASAQLLKKEFPQLHHLELKSFKINYPKKNSFVLKMLLQIPKILLGIRKEHKQVQKMIKQYNIDLIISDNRYGVYSKEVPSIFITHQIFIQLPIQIKFLEGIVYKLQQLNTSRFSKLLIPDFKEEINLTGKLSHKQKLSAKYNFIGILSQFQYKKEETEKHTNDILVILSGPEPQRSILQKKILEQLNKTKKKVIIVLGKPGNEISTINSNIEIISHLPRKKMQEVILSSKVIISRAGYTTIMDLIKLQKTAILIPTPSQTEQEYLANYLNNKNLFVFKEQSNFSIDEAVNELENLNADFSIYKETEQEDFLQIVKNSFQPNFLYDDKCVEG